MILAWVIIILIDIKLKEQLFIYLKHMKIRNNYKSNFDFLTRFKKGRPAELYGKVKKVSQRSILDISLVVLKRQKSKFDLLYIKNYYF